MRMQIRKPAEFLCDYSSITSMNSGFQTHTSPEFSQNIKLNYLNKFINYINNNKCNDFVTMF